MKMSCGMCLSLLLLSAEHGLSQEEQIRPPKRGERSVAGRAYQGLLNRSITPHLIRIDHSTGLPARVAIVLEVGARDLSMVDPYLARLGQDPVASLIVYTTEDELVTSLSPVVSSDVRDVVRDPERSLARRRMLIGGVRWLGAGPGDGPKVPHYVQLFLRRGFCGETAERHGAGSEPYLGCSEPLFLGYASSDGKFSLSQTINDRAPSVAETDSGSSRSDRRRNRLDVATWVSALPEGPAELAVMYMNLSAEPMSVFNPFLASATQTDFPGRLHVRHVDGQWKRNLSPARTERIGSYIVPNPGMYKMIPANSISGGHIRLGREIPAGEYVIDVSLDERLVNPDALREENRPAEERRVLLSKSVRLLVPEAE